MLLPAHSPRPQPDIECADCLALQRFQAFSITALVHEVSNPRPVDKDRVVRDVVICDGSKIPRRDADTLVEAIVKPTLQIFSGTSDAPMIAELTAAAGKKKRSPNVPRHSSQADRQWMESNFHASLRHL